MRFKKKNLISPLRVTAQCRLAFKSASRSYCPYLYCCIVAAGGKLGAVVIPWYRADPAFSMRCVSTRSNSGRVRKLDFFFNLTNLSARSGCTCRSPLRHPTDGPCCLCCLRRWPFRRPKRPRIWRCYCKITQKVSSHFTFFTGTFAGTDRSTVTCAVLNKQ